MEKRKQQKLEAAGWKVGDATEFLGLSQEESAIIDVKIALAKMFADQRKKRQLTQVEVAKVLHTSQPRVTLMEAGDAGVSLELLLRGYLSLGGTLKDVGMVIAKA